MDADGFASPGSIDPLEGPVGKGEVDLASGVADLAGGKSEAAEEDLGDAVVPLVFQKDGSPPGGEPGLSPVTENQAQLLQPGEGLEGGGGTHAERGGHRLERDPTIGDLPVDERLERVHLAAGQTLEGLHVPQDPETLLILGR